MTTSSTGAAPGGAVVPVGAVVRLGWTPVRGTRWLSASDLTLDAGGVVGDRAWSGVDAGLDAVRAARHPEMMQLVVREGALPTPGPDDCTVTYWHREVPASLHDGTVADQLSALVGGPVRLAHTCRRPGFIWGAGVSVLFWSELGDLPTDVDRYRANVVVDDRACPAVVDVGTVIRLGDIVLRVVEPIDRCTVIDHEATTGARDQRLMRRLRPGALLGWGCDVLRGGRLGRGATACIGWADE